MKNFYFTTAIIRGLPLQFYLYLFFFSITTRAIRYTRSLFRTMSLYLELSGGRTRTLSNLLYCLNVASSSSFFATT